MTVRPFSTKDPARRMQRAVVQAEAGRRPAGKRAPMLTRRRGAAFALAASLAASLAGCDGNGTGETLPSSRPSVERTATSEAAHSTRPSRSRETGSAAQSEPARATVTATRTEEAPPAQQPARTQTPPTHATEPAQTQTQAQTQAQTKTQPTQSSAAAVSVSETGNSGGYLGWLLLFVLVGGVFVVVVVGRSRRTAAWDAQCSDLTAEADEVTAVRLPPVLDASAAEERAVSWPPVRDDLIDLSGRWGALAARAPDDARQATADEMAILLRDLVPAIDAETRALADQGDWQRLRPEVDAILDALAASAAATAARGGSSSAAAPGSVG